MQLWLPGLESDSLASLSVTLHQSDVITDRVLTIKNNQPMLFWNQIHRRSEIRFVNIQKVSCVICKHVAATSSLKNLQIKSADKTVCMYTVQCRQRYPPKLRTHFSQVYFVVHFGIFLYFDPVFRVCNRTFVKLKPLHQNHFFFINKFVSLCRGLWNVKLCRRTRGFHLPG